MGGEKGKAKGRDLREGPEGGRKGGLAGVGGEEGRAKGMDLREGRGTARGRTWRRREGEREGDEA